MPSGVLRTTLGSRFSTISKGKRAHGQSPFVLKAASSSAASAFKATRYLVPVDDVPPGGEVVGTAVLVLEVVGVLPDVDAEQRHVVVHQRRVLVRGRLDREAGAVPDQPRPARAEPLDAAVVQR